MDALILKIFYIIGEISGITACALIVLYSIACGLRLAYWIFQQFAGWHDIILMTVRYKRQKRRVANRLKNRSNHG